MKKLICIVVMIALAVSLLLGTACSNSTSTTTITATTTVTPAAAVTVTTTVTATTTVTSQVPASTTPKTTTTTSQAGAPITLKFHLIDTLTVGTHLITQKAWAEMVEQRSGGRLKIEFYPNATLLPAAEQISGTLAGTADISQVVVPYSAKELPLAQIGGLPLFFPSNQVYADITWSMLKDTNSLLRRELTNLGLVPLFISGGAKYHFLSTKTLTDLNGLKGLKVRSPGVVPSQALVALGATAVSVTVADMYTSLERGIIDAIAFPTYAMYDQGMYDVCKNLLLVGNAGFYVMPLFYLISKTKWDTIPADIQQIMLAAGDETVPISKKGMSDLNDEFALKLQEKGVKVERLAQANVDAAKSAVKSVWDQWVKDSGPNAQALMDEYLKRIAAS